MNPIRKRMGSRLPHWTSEGATYFVTFRLADSVPAHARTRLEAELARLQSARDEGETLTLAEQISLARLRSEKVDEVLNAAHGECLMREPAIAGIVAGALAHFDRERYRLVAWCVMPNHVHVVFTPLSGHELDGVLHSWKSFTAHAINKALGRSGAVWTRESYDHLCRSDEDVTHAVLYTLSNPRKAGLKGWKWAGTSYLPEDELKKLLG